ncbi:hypothetical protein FBALC1_01577 [Flavobacteriales bacterium ALC-1]|nr:hypothetical protein FBALC1_01577 [Flavobacteriales bacterium ALC-1]
MKRIVYLLAFIGAVFTGCDPVEDINKDLAEQEEPIIGEVEYTLTDDDYADLELSFGNFSSDEDARVAIPGLLADKYPYFGDGSAALVTYKLFVGSAEGLSDFTGSDVYELTNADYATTGSDAFGFYPNVDPTEQIPAVLDAQIAAPTEGQILLVEYDQYVETPEVGLANLYSAEFPTDYDSYELVSVSGPTDLGWTVGSANVQGSGFDGGANAVEEWLVSPEIDLSSGSDLLFQITQEIDFLGDDTLIDVLVATDHMTGGDIMYATWNPVAFDKTAYSSLTASENLDFSAYDGQTIHIALKYSSTDSDSPRWRVQSLAVKAIGVSGETDAKGEYFVYEGGSWEAADDVYYLSTSDYDSMGEESGQPGRFNNFSSGTPADNYLPTFLSINYPFAQEEDQMFVIYKYFSSNSGLGTRGNLYTYTNGQWVGNQSVIDTTLQFGLENGVWVPDNTIRYTLTGADYSAIVAALEGTYPGPAGSMDNFGNFDRRPGNANEWTDSMVLEALNVVLDILDPSAADEQKYIVTVDVYIGSNTTEDFAVIKMGGEWVYQ